MTRTLLVFGDSNSHGTIPIETRGEYRRYGRDSRWPGVAARLLAPDWEVVDEALPGRTTQFDDPVMGAHMNGRIGLRIALQSHGPIDRLAIMLGTNDAKKRFDASPELIIAGIAGLIDIALSDEYQIRHDGFDLLVICPPPVMEAGVLKGEFQDGTAVSQALAPMLGDYCEKRGVAFFDAGSVISVSPVDGVHFTPESHVVLGEAIAGAVRGM